LGFWLIHVSSPDF